MRFAMASPIPLLVALLLLWGCEGPKGPQGATGPQGPEGPGNPDLAPVITALFAIPDSIGTHQTTQLVVAAYDPNGDTLSYHWVAPVGAFSSSTIPNPIWTATDSMGLFSFTVHVIAGGDTTTGTLLVGVNTYVPSVTPYYLGNNATTCGHCHESTVSGWMATGHSIAHDSLVNDPGYVEFCYPCHNTGWNENVDNGGYDDNPVEALANVQCEQCHGPMGPNPATHQPNMADNLSGATCAAQCHTFQPAEWVSSRHGTAMENAGGMAAFIDEWGNPSQDCNNCHIGEGFLNKWDASYQDNPLSFQTTANQITCGICHDAHDQHTELQLRAQVPIVLPNPAGYTISGWGMGLVCGNCHRDRRTPTQIQNQLDNGTSHFGPHSSPEADMVAGTGTYEIPGYSYPATPNQHANFPNACVNCHMAEEEHAEAGTTHNHTFEPQLLTCQSSLCHPGATSFNIEGVQDEVEALMNSLQTMILSNNPVLADSGWSESTVGDTAISTYEDRVAAWAWFFVEQDGTFGVHNKDYAMLILQNSIDYYNSVLAQRKNESLWGAK